MARSLRILVVDDNYDAAEMLALAIEALGHIVVVATDGGMEAGFDHHHVKPITLMAVADILAAVASKPPTN